MTRPVVVDWSNAPAGGVLTRIDAVIPCQPGPEESTTRMINFSLIVVALGRRSECKSPAPCRQPMIRRAAAPKKQTCLFFTKKEWQPLKKSSIARTALGSFSRFVSTQLSSFRRGVERHGRLEHGAEEQTDGVPCWIDALRMRQHRLHRVGVAGDFLLVAASPHFSPPG